MEALQQGQDVVEDLRSKASVEDFERILQQQKETQEQEDELRQMLKDAGIDDEEVMDDIDHLEAEILGKEIDKKVPNKPIKNRSVDEEEVEEPAQKTTTKKKVVVA